MVVLRGFEEGFVEEVGEKGGREKEEREVRGEWEERRRGGGDGKR